MKSWKSRTVAAAALSLLLLAGCHTGGNLPTSSSEKPAAQGGTPAAAGEPAAPTTPAASVPPVKTGPSA